MAGRRSGGRAERTSIDVVEEDMKSVGVRGEEDAEERVRWGQTIGCGCGHS